ncbi:hypothetical protein EC973_009039 [Apophysomyces ossiformis]|uniref:UBA domain-containing protein n=1 Tax=Apophysomyces ossiformis TaxID=679940 RepID=A0A8H7BRQ3_9FUNG|nr:hypothetical protein EC973_009039 [Apophysomyces ossiformis]
MVDQGSVYSVLQDVPVMVSPHYKLPKQIHVISELLAIPDDLSQWGTYTFAAEREALAEIAAVRNAQKEADDEFARRKKEFEEEKIKKQKVAARKIAPGFLDTDTRILKPEPLYGPQRLPAEKKDTTKGEEQEALDEEGWVTLQRQPRRSRSASNPGEKTSVEQDKGTFIDYLKFEQGLSPPDPWDTPENDLVALRSILGDLDTKANPRQAHHAASKKTVGTHTNVMPPQYSSSYVRNITPQYPPDGYWYKNSSTPLKSSYSSQSTTRHTSAPVAPALPPKLFLESTSSAHTSPRVRASTLSQPSTPPPPPSDYRKTESALPSGTASPTIPPPLPPLPPTSVPKDELVHELVNMGFSRPQAMEALEKNDNDLTKATNFLLDAAALEAS